MAQSSPAFVKLWRTGGALSSRWISDVAIAVAVGATYFLVARITILGAAFQPDKSTLFWPAAGISAGILIIADGQRRWAVVAGVLVAEAIVAHISWSNPWLTAILAVCNPMEALTVAWLVGLHSDGAPFTLDRTRNVFSLLGATVVSAVVPSLMAAAAKTLLLGPPIMMLPTWLRWYAGDVVGILIVVPLVIGLADAVRHPSSRRECIEGAIALLLLAAVTSFIIFLPQEIWRVLLPIALPFPILLWIAGRLRPVFAAAGAFLVSGIITWTATFGIGHFGDPSSSLSDRALEAQAAILFLAISAYILAALFAERRESEALLARANFALQRERDNKLLNAEATAGSIAHELRQPLAAMSANAEASLVYLEQSPPNLLRVSKALDKIVTDIRRTSEMLDGTRALFRNIDQRRQTVDMNEIAREVLRSARTELKNYGIAVESEFSSETVSVFGNRGQLQQVVSNLVNNAIEAMIETTGRRRVLRLTTRRGTPDRVTVIVQDTGPGIALDRLKNIFDAFTTTKPRGTGLGLAICQIIIQRHRGELTAFSDGKYGAMLQFSIPTNSSEATDCN